MNEHTEHFATKADLVSLKTEIKKDIAEREYLAARKKTEKWAMLHHLTLAFIFGLIIGHAIGKGL